MKTSINESVMLAFACIMSIAQTSAADWPQWRGQKRDVKFTDFNAPATWPKELKQEWRVPAGAGSGMGGINTSTPIF